MRRIKSELLVSYSTICLEPRGKRMLKTSLKINPYYKTLDCDDLDPLLV